MPRFTPTHHADLQRLGATDVAKRRAAAADLAKYKGNSAVVRALMDALLQDPDPRVRQAAATTLARIAAKQARGMLAYAAVCDPDPATRQGLERYAQSNGHKKAHIECHRHTHPKGLAQIPTRGDRNLPRYLWHPKSEVRLRALRLLAKRRDPKLRRRLWEMATRDPFWAVRVDALKALAPQYQKKVLPLLKYALGGDPDQRVRRAAFEVLAYLRQPSTIPWLVRSIRGEPALETRRAAIAALGSIGGAAAARALAQVCTADRGHPDAETRLAALKTLRGQRGQQRLVQRVLARALREDPSPQVRAEAMRGAAGSRGEDLCQARIQRLKDPAVEVRRVLVAQVKQGCPTRQAEPALSRVALEDDSGEVRRAAVSALLAYRATQPLLAVLEHEPELTIRRQILDALGTLPARVRRDALFQVLRADPEESLRLTALARLARERGALSSKELADLLGRDTSAKVREQGARMLGRHSDQVAYQALRQTAAKDEDETVRRVAARSLARSPARKAWVNALLSRTIDGSATVRLAAVNELCSMQLPKTYRVLVRLLWVDPEPRVRTAIAKCFTELESPLIDIGISVARATEANRTVSRAIEQTQRARATRLRKQLATLDIASDEDRLAIIRQLFPTPVEEVRARLMTVISSDTSPEVRRAAADAIYRYADRKAAQQLLKAARQQKDSAVRRHLLARGDDLRRRHLSARQSVALDTLLQTLRTGGSKARIRAAQMLGVRRDRGAFAALREAARSADPDLRYAAVVALATFGDQTIVSKTARSETDDVVRDQLIQLNYLRSAPAEQVLAALRSANPQENLRGIEAAAIHRIDEAVPHLARLALSHLHKSVRLAAARTLTLYDKPLAFWTVRVASSHDASKKLRLRMWSMAVLADSGS